MATSFIERFRDDFDNGVVDLDTDLGNGLASEANDKLRLAGPVGVVIDWWSGATESAPIAYKQVTQVITEPTIFKAELRLDALSSSISTNEAGLVTYLDRDNAYIFKYGGPETGSTGNIGVNIILNDSASGLTSVGSITNPNDDPIEFRTYWSIAPKTVTEPDLGFSIAPNTLYWYYKRDSIGTWTLLHSRTRDFKIRRAAFYLKRWVSTPEIYAEADYLTLSEYNDTDAPTIDQTTSYDPSTTFSDATLPKTWARRLNSAPDYDGNTITMLNPGVQISCPTKYDIQHASTDWAGIAGAGWGIVAEDEEFDLEARWENFTLNDTAVGANAPSFGMFLEWSNRNKKNSFNSITNVFVGRKRSGRSYPTWDEDLLMVASGDGYAGNFWNSIHGSVTRPTPNGTGEDRVRLIRVSTTDYSAYYWDGDAWEPLALNFTPGVGQTGNNLAMLSKFGRITFGAHTHDFYPNAWCTVDLKEFKVNYGAIAPRYATAPDDDFADASRKTDRYFSHTYSNLYYPNDNATEIAGAIEWDLQNFWYRHLGVQWTHSFFPGTDIDVEFDMEHDVNANVNGEAVESRVFFFSPFAQVGPIPHQSGTRDEVYLQLEERDPNYGGRLEQEVYVQPRTSSNPGTLVGSRNDTTHAIWTGPYTTTIKVRVTRVDNVWTWYTTVNGAAANQVAQWTDTNRVMTDFPVRWGVEITNHYDGNNPKCRVENFTVNSGDWELPALSTSVPVISNQVPAPDETGVTTDSNISFSVTDDDLQVDYSTMEIKVNDEYVLLSGVVQSGWTSSTVTANTENGFDFVLDYDEAFLANSEIEVYVFAEDQASLSVAETWSFFTLGATPAVGHGFTLNELSLIGVPIPINKLNQFDEHGSMVSLPRLRGEKNWEYRRRIFDAMVNQANSSYRGMVNGITRELGLTLFDAMCVNPKVDSSGRFLAPDPYIVFDGAYLNLYSDYSNDLLDWSIDRHQVGGNYEHLGRLVDMVNETAFFEAGLNPDVDRYTKSMTVLNQSNRDRVRIQFVPQSTRFRLKHKYIVSGTLFFSNRDTFRTEVTDVSDVDRRGRYHVDYAEGIVTVYTVPHPKEYTRYQYVRYPFCPVGSPVILHDINRDTFRAKMFEQVLQDDGTYEHGLPTELGVDIINELLAVSPMYWGI